MMLILKLPILYLAGVCYWAIKAEPEPRPLEGARVQGSPRSRPEHTSSAPAAAPRLARPAASAVRRAGLGPPARGRAR